MATTDYDFSSTRNEIIQRALRLVGALALGEVVSAEAQAQAVQALNSVVKAWQSKRVFLWTLKTITQTLSASTASYVLSSDPAVVAIDRAWLVNGTSDGPHLDIFSWRQYQDLTNKSNSGDPTLIAIDNQGAPTLYVWPVPTATKTLKLLAITRLKDFDSASGTADFPVHFQEALTYALAEALSDEYGLAIYERERLEKKAKDLFKEAARSDRQRADNDFVDGAFSC